jgi:hypothetical protein
MKGESRPPPIWFCRSRPAKWTNLDFPYPYDNMTPVGISNTGVIALQYSASGGMVIATPPSN